MMTHTIQIDEETGADEVWDALHAYASTHPAPPCLSVYVDGTTCWPGARAVTAGEAETAQAWLAAATQACGWGARTTPILVIRSA